MTHDYQVLMIIVKLLCFQMVIGVGAAVKGLSNVKIAPYFWEFNFMIKVIMLSLYSLFEACES